MEIRVQNSSKILEIWLNNSEKCDDLLREGLGSLYREYKAKNYLVAVFQSGTQDLTGVTSDLLCYNRTHLAEQKIRRARKKPGTGPQKKRPARNP